MKLHLDATVFVGPDFLARLTYHDGGLRPVDDGPGCDAFGAIGVLFAHRGELAVEKWLRLLGFCCFLGFEVFGNYGVFS